jgi:alpha-N-acetylglucosaminidase
LEWAKAWSRNETNIANLEYNARNILTLWGPTGQINDYAKKEWGGLVRGYYRPRWNVLIEQAVAAATARTPWDQAACGARIMAEVQLPFQTNRSVYPTKPEADAVAVSKALLAKYVPH